MALNKENNSFVLTFAVGMCVVLAIALAGTYQALSKTIEDNELFDQKLNVLIAVGLHSKQALDEGALQGVYGEQLEDPTQLAELSARHAAKTREELETLYSELIRSEVLEVVREEVTKQVKRGGEMVDLTETVVKDLVPAGFAVDELAARQFEEGKKPEAERREFAPFYTRVDENGAPVAYCLPVSGLGLWGQIYGYLALESNLDDVQGITFYKHKETPGLGGNIDIPEWQRQWTNKSILDDAGEFVSVIVKKGAVDPSVPVEAAHYVDGLSGATITSNGVTNFVREDLQTYWPHLQRLREQD
ncbi:MAG: NADH:ubiquinone reductase (Na(+)-transporting) subunit C [Planctomycetota bacterium]